MNRRRSITRLTDPKAITEGVSRYCLVAQEHDTDGELETKLYKVCLPLKMFMNRSHYVQYLEKIRGYLLLIIHFIG